MSLLPSRPDASPAEDTEPRVIGVDSEDAEEVLSALSSETARNLLAEVHDDPAPPSELAERVDTSLQNAQYHLENLESAGAVEVVDTAYSAKGREMDVYAAADQPLVIFAGDQEEGSVLRSALQRLVGALGALAAASLAIQALFGRDLSVDTPAGDGAGDDSGAVGDGDASGADGGDGGGVTGDDTAEATETPAPETLETPTEEVTATATPEPMATPTVTPEPVATSTPAPEAVDGTVGAAASLPPGLLFFAGGAFVLAVVAAVWYLGQ